MTGNNDSGVRTGDAGKFPGVAMNLTLVLMLGLSREILITEPTVHGSDIVVQISEAHFLQDFQATRPYWLCQHYCQGT
jgi:hypothetical protein